MPFFLVYLLKASICMMPFYIAYVLFLRRLTFFQWNRIYLLGSLCISVMIPLLQLPASAATVHYTIGQVLQSTAVPRGDLLPAEIPAYRPPVFTWMNLIVSVYFTGTALMLFLFIRNLWHIRRIVRAGTIIRRGKLKVILTEATYPNASFFRYVFLSAKNLNEAEVKQVLAHEECHFTKSHSLDILFMELIKAVWWFNPLVYQYKKLLQDAHEYEVDREVCRLYDRKQYAGLLLRLNRECGVTGANQFSMHPLKDRLRILFYKASPNTKRLLYLAVLPLVLIACDQLAKKEAEKAFPVLTVQPDYVKMVVDSTTGIDKLRAAATVLKKEKNIDLTIIRYETDDKGKIALISLEVKDPLLGRTVSATWNPGEREGENFWKRYNIVFLRRYDAGARRPMRLVSMTRLAAHSAAARDYVTSGDILTRGRKLFNTNCASCHNPVKDMTGPALAGAEQRRGKIWIYHFIHDPAAMVEKDSSARSLFKKWDQIQMPAFPQLSEQDLDDIMAYVGTAATGF